MTAMTEAWLRRNEIAEIVKPVSKRPLEELNDSEVAQEAVKVSAALEVIDAIRGYADTATAKLFHRLRPNLGPIWDQRIADWYASHKSDKDWQPWVERIFTDVRKPETLQCLVEVRQQLGLELSVLRIWDVLLWQLRGPLAIQH